MEWIVASSQGGCGVCGRRFSEREEYWSALFAPGETFERKDYCEACWHGGQDGMFSFWQTKAKVKPAPPKRFVDDSVLLDFFERLCTSEDPAKARFRFIMAVLLLRKRLLKERSRRQDAEGTTWVVEVPRLGRSFEVRDEALSESEIGQLLSEIGQVLNLELSGDEAEGA